MADQAPAATPAKKKRAQSPRTQRPLFAVVRYTDENGVEVRLDKSRLSIQVERDAAKLLELVTSGDGAGNATVMQLQLPEPQRRAAPAAAQGNAA
jgi:hypothetical protein